MEAAYDKCRSLSDQSRVGASREANAIGKVAIKGVERRSSDPCAAANARSRSTECRSAEIGHEELGTRVDVAGLSCFRDIDGLPSELDARLHLRR